MVKLNIKSFTPTSVIINPILAIPIGTFTSKDQPSLLTCFAYEAELVITVQPPIIPPSRTPQSPPPTTPQEEPTLVHSQHQNEVVYEIQSETEHIVQDLSLDQFTSNSNDKYEHSPFELLHPEIFLKLFVHSNISFKPEHSQINHPSILQTIQTNLVVI